MRDSKLTLVPGLRFRPAEPTAGSETVGPWQIIKVFTGTDGLDYAQLRNDADPSRVKSVACSALLNRKFYTKVEPS